MTGLTSQGFERKRLPDIVAEIETAMKATFGEDIDLRPESLFSQLIGTLALPISELWEEAENVYISKDPDFAEGVQLDVVAALTGTVRLAETYSEAGAVFIGLEGTEIPAGTILETVRSDQFVTEEAVFLDRLSAMLAEISITIADSTDYTITIDGVSFTYTSDASATEAEITAGIAAAVGSVVTTAISGPRVTITPLDGLTPFSVAVSADLNLLQLGAGRQAIATTAGVIAAGPGELNSIVTPIANIDAVTNPLAADIGSDREGDGALKLRRARSVAAPAQSMIEAITANLLRVTGVDGVQVRENNTNDPDAEGTPGHTIWPIVLGGDDDEIARVIFERKAAGIGLRGAQAVAVTASTGQDFTIQFDRPTPIPIFVSMTIQAGDDFAVLGEDQIRNAIVAWATENLEFGAEVTYSRLFTPINSVPDHEVLDLRIGLDPNPTGQVSINLPPEGVAEFTVGNIAITKA